MWALHKLNREPGNSLDWLSLLSLRYSRICPRFWINHLPNASPFRFRFFFRPPNNFIPVPNRDRDSWKTRRKYIVHPIQKRRGGDSALSLVPRLGFLFHSPLNGRQRKEINPEQCCSALSPRGVTEFAMSPAQKLLAGKSFSVKRHVTSK